MKFPMLQKKTKQEVYIKLAKVGPTKMYCSVKILREIFASNEWREKNRENLFETMCRDFENQNKQNRPDNYLLILRLVVYFFPVIALSRHKQ